MSNDGQCDSDTPPIARPQPSSSDAEAGLPGEAQGPMAVGPTAKLANDPGSSWRPGGVVTAAENTKTAAAGQTEDYDVCIFICLSLQLFICLFVASIHIRRLFLMPAEGPALSEQVESIW